jgi:hypothetical protein
MIMKGVPAAVSPDRLDPREPGPGLVQAEMPGPLVVAQLAGGERWRLGAATRRPPAPVVTSGLIRRLRQVLGATAMPNIPDLSAEGQMMVW